MSQEVKSKDCIVHVNPSPRGRIIMIQVWKDRKLRIMRNDGDKWPLAFRRDETDEEWYKNPFDKSK